MIEKTLGIWHTFPCTLDVLYCLAECISIITFTWNYDYVWTYVLISNIEKNLEFNIECFEKCFST